MGVSRILKSSQRWRARRNLVLPTVSVTADVTLDRCRQQGFGMQDEKGGRSGERERERETEGGREGDFVPPSITTRR